MRLLLVVCVVAVAGVAVAETRQAVPDRYFNTFSHTNPVFLRIREGDIVATKTLDSGGMDDHGQSRAMGGNPLTGPTSARCFAMASAMRFWCISARFG